MRLIIIQKRWIIRVFILLISVTILSKTLLYRKKCLETGSLPTMAKVIVIDPGHGGYDPGRPGFSGKDEKDINLAISLYLREYLEQSGSIVIMIREKDTDLYVDDGSGRRKKTIDLTSRKDIVIKNKPHALISIHVNSFPQSRYYGAQTFYSRDNEESKRLALIIQEELIRVLNNDNRRQVMEKNDVYILKGLDIPAVLVECGFLSNPQEEQKLNDPQYQQKVAWSIYVGLQRYFKTSFRE
ncbi:MAG: N-acetylmuramoyl-L-alanine amidase CwlD [Natronincolaceae bacterium]|nr:N-acetylmuramoyl-L-alanine amidase CwlD [Bacillota bacterium]